MAGRNGGPPAWPAAAPSTAASANADPTPLADSQPPADDHGRCLRCWIPPDHVAGQRRRFRAAECEADALPAGPRQLRPGRWARYLGLPREHRAVGGGRPPARVGPLAWLAPAGGAPGGRDPGRLRTRVA